MSDGPVENRDQHIWQQRREGGPRTMHHIQQLLLHRRGQCSFHTSYRTLKNGYTIFEKDILVLKTLLVHIITPNTLFWNFDNMRGFFICLLIRCHFWFITGLYLNTLLLNVRTFPGSKCYMFLFFK